MSRYSGIHFLIICTIILLLACLCAGCTSSQSPAQPVHATPQPSGSLNVIAIKDFAFSPATLTVKTGTTVSWTNDDSVPHTVVSDAGSPVPFTSPQLAAGASFSQTFTSVGTYAYHCSIHPSMKGTLIVEP